MKVITHIVAVSLLPLLVPLQALAECKEGQSEVVVVTPSGISKTICVDDNAIPGIEQAAENSPLELVHATFTCSKPINELTMIWDGSQTIDVTAYYGYVGATQLGTLTEVEPGDEVSFSGYAGSPNDVQWQIIDSSSGSILGVSEFHLSCSDEDMNGPEDCGKRQGDGKSNDENYINDWIFEGMIDSDETLDCTP